MPRVKKRPAAEPPEVVRSEWLRRVQAEYQSAAITGQLSHWLIQLGAPGALIRMALRIVADELRHAELSDRVYRAAGGSSQATLARDRLELPRAAGSLEHDLTRVVVQTYCLGETAAVRLFSRMRHGCSVRVARAALDRVLRDEVRHRDFGWRSLEWLLELPDGPARRAGIQRALPELVATLRENYAPETPPPPTDFPAAARVWGLIPLVDYRDAVELCITRDLRPRFARLQIHMA